MQTFLPKSISIQKAARKKINSRMEWDQLLPRL